MMCFKNILCICLTFSLLTSCIKENNTNDIKEFWDNFNLAGTKVKIDKDSVLIVYPEKAENEKSFLPIELIVENIEYIKLDSNHENSLINIRFPHVFLTENYIAIMYGSEFALKLFKKNGNYVREIGKKGQGPGEYNSIMNFYLEEEKDRIYILPINSKNILTYNFNGDFLFSIPLADGVLYGSSIKVDTQKEEILVTNPLFTFVKYCIWVQNFQGEIIKSVSINTIFDELDTSSEATMTFFRSNNIEYFNVSSKNSKNFLYHYNAIKNRLVPQFRIESNSGRYESIMINELPYIFIIETLRNIEVSDNLESTPKIVIDKSTFKGFQLEGFQLYPFLYYNEYSLLSRMRGPYFSILDFGSEIKQKIIKSNKNKMNESEKQKMEEILSVIGDVNNDDCCILFYGKLINKKK